MYSFRDPKVSAPLLELKNVVKDYRGQRVVGPLNLSIPNSQFVTLLGPSGCGKTTVLRLLAGLETATSGKIFLSKIDITKASAAKRPMHTIFQKYALFPHMSVFDNVAFGPRMHGVVAEGILKKKVMDTLKSVQMAGFADRFPAELSGGQQQRIAIARAIVNQPAVLLLDECLSALDYHLRRRLQNELKALQRDLGITFVFVTHDQEEALSMADRILVMKEGNIEQDGAPRSIYESPKNLFVAKFIGDSNLLDGEVLDKVSETQVNMWIEGTVCAVSIKNYLQQRPGATASSLIGKKMKLLLRPEDLRLKELGPHQQAQGITGYVRERNYRGMMLDSLVQLTSGREVLVSEFFNEDDPDVDHSLHQKVEVSWVPNWEVVLDNE